MNKIISALFVAENGPYFNLENIIPWDIKKDARLYNGPYPVIAHPPCERWGRYWSGGPIAKVRRKLGDDNGCFKSALTSVRKFGGILEHPEASHAFKAFGIKTPPKKGGWIIADEYGFCCCVEQGNYGHNARKATWLYSVGTDLPDLIWGKAYNKMSFEDGFHSKQERLDARANGFKRVKRSLPVIERTHTPIMFRDLLIGLARSAKFDTKKKIG